MDIERMIALDSVGIDGSFSIRKINDRQAFWPGQYEELEVYLPGYKTQHPEIAEQIDKLWTSEAIATWEKEQAELQAELT